MKYRPLDVAALRTYSLKDRESIVSLAHWGTPHRRGASLRDFAGSLPDFLAARDLKTVVQAVPAARKAGRPVVLGMGAHPIKVGLSRVIIDLMRRGIITALATNGAALVHDFEIALVGKTSEDVASELPTGDFGMARETGQILNTAISQGVQRGLGMGQAVGEYIHASSLPYREESLFREAFRSEIPATVHVAVGSDIIHMHPEADGASIGEGSMRDFRLFSSVIADLDGGVYINLGSAVIMPEVFMKALSVARNLGHRVQEFTTVNMDFIQHYRPRENVLRRPTLGKGQAFAITGHHEIMFPLLAALVIEGMD